jgi:transcriptional regulator GlxA family with amidase domain
LQYALHLRVEAASGEVIGTERSIREIAERFGFENQFHFSRVFKKCTGLSPSTYRKYYIQHVDLLPPSSMD